MALFSLIGREIQALEGIFSLAYYRGSDAVTGMKNLEKKSRKEDVTKNVFKKLEGLHLPCLTQNVFAHINLKKSAIGSAQTCIDALITEHWVTLHLDYPDNKDFVNQTAGLRGFRSFSARGLAHSNGVFTFAQLPMRRSEQRAQHWAPRN